MQQIPAARDPIAELRGAFGEAIVDVRTFRDETTIVAHPDAIEDIMRFLRTTPGLVYNFLSDISAVDYYPDPATDTHPERFAVAYHIYSMIYNRRLRVKTYVPEEAPVVPTIVGEWPAANWLEREIMDLMGIDFDGHPDKRRLMMPDDWNGHPHRRDVPLGKEVIQFSFNAQDIMDHKPFAKE